MTNEQLLTIVLPLGGLILTSIIAIVGLILTQAGAQRSELHEFRSELHWGLREAARDRMTHLRGFLEGLRESITCSNVA